MKQIITKDGSITYHNTKYAECYHTISGALEEAQKKYVEPCNILSLAKKGKITILDVGFGLGYNPSEAISAAKKENPNVEITIVTLENDPQVFSLISEIKDINSSYKLVKKLASTFSGKDCMVTEGRITLKLLFGDGVKKIAEVNEKFDAVFFDPFSPKKNPDMWTAPFFRAIFEKMKPKGILATYSCARITRDNLKTAGFIVSDGPIIGRRSPATIAKKQVL